MCINVDKSIGLESISHGFYRKHVTPMWVGTHNISTKVRLGLYTEADWEQNDSERFDDLAASFYNF
jgi:hypothetical protein